MSVSYLNQEWRRGLPGSSAERCAGIARMLENGGSSRTNYYSGVNCGVSQYHARYHPLADPCCQDGDLNADTEMDISPI